MNLLYYLTAHGYGHGVRACAICKELSPQVQVLFRTLLPKIFFQEEVHRPFLHFPGQFDCGCIQKDSITVDKGRTLATYHRIADDNVARLEEEVKWCAAHQIDGIVSDITPFAFEVAQAAALPSVAVTNFTWYDIYAPYAQPFPDFNPMLQKILEQYRSAGLLLELTPAVDMPYFRERKRVSWVGRVGKKIRERLVDHLGLHRERHIGLIYAGEFGMDGVSWKDLEKFPEWEFIGIYPLPGSPRNYHPFSKEDFRYEDLSATVDVMISKIGYGTVAECLLYGTPLIYLPREDFAEHPVLEKAVLEWGHGYCLSKEDYVSLNWHEVLRSVTAKGRPPPQISDAARICAREIEKWVSR